MWSLAYESSQVPSRYQVNPGTLSVEESVIASGAYTDVRKGRLGDRTVAVKTLRIGNQIDFHDAQKVCVLSN